jgi:hypothetical protein
MSSDWAFKPWGAEKKQSSIFDPVNTHTDFGTSTSSSWAYESGSNNGTSNWGSSSSDSGSWAYGTANNTTSNFHSNSSSGSGGYGSNNGNGDNWAFSVGSSTRNAAFGGSPAGGSGWSSPFTASCDTHYLDLKARERGMSSNFNSGSSWAFSDVNSLNEVRGRINHYDNRRNGSQGAFGFSQQKSYGFSAESSFNPFAPSKLKKT